MLKILKTLVLSMTMETLVLSMAMETLVLSVVVMETLVIMKIKFCDMLLLRLLILLRDKKLAGIAEIRVHELLRSHLPFQ